MGFMDILTHITKIQLKFEAELRGIRPNEIKIICFFISIDLNYLQILNL